MLQKHKQTDRQAMPIIAIGASAGGLEACSSLLKRLPSEMQAAFVLVLHLAPKHDSMVAELLARDTDLTVLTAQESMALRPGHLYVIPPGVYLTITHGVLHMSAPETGKAVRLPFDVLLRSLAQEATSPLACIILSGTGTDGSSGIDAIRNAGGLILAQDPEEASYSGMPEAAIKTGLVDQVLTIQEIPAALAKLTPLAPVRAGRTASQKPDLAKPDARTKDLSVGAEVIQADPDFDAIIALVAESATQNVTLYKTGTIQRRIARRMGIAGCKADDTNSYLARLRADKGELAQLTADLLIHVTSFFRDPTVFAHLSQTALPEFITTQPQDRPLRVWVAGCSTGEEAYSLTILCIEALEAAGSTAGLQVFASDIDPDAVATARDGFYPPEISKSMSPERLARFFTPESGGWRVHSELRDVIVFTVADLLSDPPFSRIDLLSCRNVLIYLEAQGQRRVIGQCSFALRQGGLLLLGSAEVPGPSEGRFELVDKGARLWRCIGQGRPEDIHVATRQRVGAPLVPVPQSTRPMAFAELCRRLVLESYAPAAVLLNRRLECLYLLGPTERYLSVTQGHPDPSFLGMLPRAMHARLRAAVATCDSANPLVVVVGGHSAREGRFNIELRAVKAGGEQLLLACFVNAPDVAQSTRTEAATSGEDTARIAQLEADLDATRSELRDALRDLEQEVESHASDSAEALSVNEEFQSTNEELLASKEELQALNEELTALNGQLQETLERHRTTANDLQNVLYSTDVATIFLDCALNIRFFTPAVRALFHVIATDIGRPLADLAALSSDDHLGTDAVAVLASSQPIEREISSKDGVWFLRRVQTYRADGGQVEGVVITFTDITERKRVHAALVAAKREADRATIAKSRFLAAASHDLRQPLQSLAFLHGLMTRDKRSVEGLRLATLMDRTLHSMTEMLDTLLDVNRIESGIVRPELRAVAIAPVLKRLSEEFAPLCELKGLKLRVVQSSAVVRTDPQLLQQILRNLLSNALKYTSKGGLLIGCRIKGSQLVVQVHDTGIGVAESERKAIFDAYYQVESSGPLAANGLGLGLSIVQRLAKLLKHPISVTSILRKGSNFMITLPVVNAPPDVLVDPAPAQGDPVVQTGTILLVEDEDDLRNLLVEVLEGAGHSVVIMTNAQDASAWAANAAELPDMLITDFALYGSASGLSLAKDLPNVLGVVLPTIILTGDITTATLKDIAKTPFDQIAKPVLPEVLLARIAKLLQTSRAARTKRPARAGESVQSTLHVVDDDPMIREATRRLFEAEGWAVVSYPTAEAFLAAPRPGPESCLVVDGMLPGMGGVELLEVLSAEHASLPAVMLTANGDIAMAVNAMKAGAADLIEKPTSAADLLGSVSDAIARTTDDRARNTARRSAQKSFAALTPRERAVLAKVLDGAPNKIIAADLGINQRTVENHRAAVMRKTRVQSLPELVRLALAAGQTTGR